MVKLQEIVGDKMPKIKCTQQYDDFNNGFETGENHMIEHFSYLDIPTANVDEINEAIYTEGLMPLPDFGRAIAEKYWLIPKEGE